MRRGARSRARCGGAALWGSLGGRARHERRRRRGRAKLPSLPHGATAVRPTARIAVRRDAVQLPRSHASGGVMQLRGVIAGAALLAAPALVSAQAVSKDAPAAPLP